MNREALRQALIVARLLTKKAWEAREQIETAFESVDGLWQQVDAMRQAAEQAWEEAAADE